MVFLYVRHTVRNYKEWKTHFDAAEGSRLKYGIELRKIFRSISMPNDVFILLEAGELEAAYEFFRTDRFKKGMEKAGVLSEPEIHFLELSG